MEQSRTALGFNGAISWIALSQEKCKYVREISKVSKIVFNVNRKSHDTVHINRKYFKRNLKNIFFGHSVYSSVVDPKLFIPDPDLDPALNFPSSGSGSRQKFRIHADPDPDPQHWYTV